MFGIKNKKQIEQDDEIFVRATTDEDSDLESILKKRKDPKKYRFEWLVNVNLSLLGFLTFSSFATTGFFYAYSESIKNKQKEISSDVLRLDNLFEKIEKNATNLKTNPKNSLELIELNSKNIENTIGKISETNHSYEKSLMVIDINNLDSFKLLVNNWEEAKKPIDIFTKNKLSVIDHQDINKKIKESIKQIVYLSALIKEEFKNINSDSAKNIEFAYSFLLDIKNLESLLLSSDEILNDEYKKTLLSSINNILQKTKTIKDISEKIPKLNESIVLLEDIFVKSISTETLIKDLETKELIRENENKLIEEIGKAKYNLFAIKKVVENNVAIEFLGFNYQTISFLLFSTSAIFLILISLSLYARSITTLKLANVFKKNQSNEEALGELLEQIKPMDDGDYTKPIFVDDKFLFNISKRIDKTRIQFGDTVRQMKVSSGNILNVAGTTDKSSQELLTLSKKEYEKLTDAIIAINEITTSIDEIAQIAWVAKDESAKSTLESEKGKELVEESINKMNEIRETIQESSKKIKKLGESAQSITEVTGLIKDITKQINILALNAAIQAASSGESGKEFTVVAKEVQRLAYDSEEATQKIEELIKDIQLDTSVAISSMEKTTQEVVIGSKLTEETGVALSEIKKLSKSTAEQINVASSRLEEKSTEMATIAFEMQGLQEISKVAQQALDITAAQVEKLKDVSVELEETFQKYKI